MVEVEDTGFEAHLIGATDSRSLTLVLSDWSGAKVAAADSVTSLLSQQFGVLDSTVDISSGNVEV